MNAQNQSEKDALDQARAWDQGWRAAVAWSRLGASGDLPPNPYVPSTTPAQTPGGTS